MPVEIFAAVLLAKTLRNVFHCDSALRFVGKSVIMWIFSYSVISLHPVYTVMQKKVTNFLSCASLSCFTETGEFFFHIR